MEPLVRVAIQTSKVVLLILKNSHDLYDYIMTVLYKKKKKKKKKKKRKE